MGWGEFEDPTPRECYVRATGILKNLPEPDGEYRRESRALKIAEAQAWAILSTSAAGPKEDRRPPPPRSPDDWTPGDHR